MATLEKIRSKSVLLLVIVGAALLAFIIGDFFTSGRTLFGTGTTIAKVGNHKVDVQEFQRRVQDATQQAQGRKIDNAVIQQQVLNSMIAEALFKQEIADLGIVVTDDELTSMMVGQNSAYVDQMVRQQMGAESAQSLHDMAYNPGKYGIPQDQALQLQQYWVNLENQVEQMLLQQKFQNLFTGTMVANDLDAKALYEDNAATAHILYAKKDYASLDDADYQVSDADLRDAYNKDRNRYKLDNDVRSISYIAVDIVPSTDDIVKGQQKVEAALAALSAQPDAQGLADMPDFVVDRKKYTAKNLESQPRLKAFADSASVGSAALVNKVGNDYTLAKLLARPSEIDGATIDFIMVQDSRENVDSLVAALNAGASFDSIATNPVVASSQKEFEVSLIDPNFASVKEIIETAPVGRYFTPDTIAQGGRIFRVVKRDEPAPVWDLAVVTFTTEPSNATVNNLQSNLQKYVSDNKTAADFVKNATDAGYSAIPTQINVSSPQIAGIADTHAAVAWAVDAKKGNVSPVFGDITSGKFIAVALNDIYDGGFVPVRDAQVSTSLTSRVRNDKKAAALIAQYQGKANDIDGYAKLMEATVDTTTVNFGQYMIPGLGMNESEIMGAVAVAGENSLIGPIQGNNGVVVIYVTNVDKEGRPYNADESAIRFNQQRGAARLGNNLNNILIGNKKVTNNINTFYK